MSKVDKDNGRPRDQNYAKADFCRVGGGWQNRPLQPLHATTNDFQINWSEIAKIIH